ncbi:MAG: hypothetical protein ACKVOH_05075 [Chlamydiales bacterium]
MITIGAKLQPFSHKPGQRCAIPGTKIIVEAYPSLVRIDGREVLLDIEGPLRQFTLLQDLERGCVTIFSEKYRFHILPNGEIIHKKLSGLPIIPREKLSLGSHKSQEWERKKTFAQIFPVWFALGRLIQAKGEFPLLDICKQTVALNRPERVLPAFERLFLSGFSHMMVPRLYDDDFQAISQSGGKGDPFVLLSEGAILIRSLFIQSTKQQVSILPHLPPEFHTGRFCHLAVDTALLDMEWSKKQIRRIALLAKNEGEIEWRFSPDIKRYRLRIDQAKKGDIKSVRESLVIKSDTLYLLDQFEK